MATKVTAANLDEVIGEILTEYAEDIQMDLVEVTNKVSQAGAKALRSASRSTFGGSGKYASGWAVEKAKGDRQIVAEIVREKLLYCLDKEIPHGTAVEVDRFTQREEDGIIDLDVTIYCEKESHKRIIIGKNGSMLKKIGQLARRDVERYMGEKVFLQSWVKVKENWRDSGAMLRNFGYDG